MRAPRPSTAMNSSTLRSALRPVESQLAESAGLSRTLLLGLATVAFALPAAAQTTIAQNVRYGTGCPTSNNQVLRADADLPVIGRPWCLSSTGGPPNGAGILLLGSSRAQFPLPGAPRCFLYLAPAVTVPTRFNSRGEAEFCGVIGLDPALRGVRLYSQWAALDAPANALGIVTSDGLEHRMGTLPQSTLTGISSRRLNVNDIVTLQGINLPKDLDGCFMIMDPGGVEFARLEPTARGLRVARVPAGGIRGGRLMAMRGSGARPTVPGTTRLSNPGETFSWDGVGFAENMAMLPGTVDIQAPPIPPGPCVTAYWSLNAAKSCVTVNLPSTLPCSVLAYNPGTTLLTDVHFNTVCGTATTAVHFDFFMKKVTVVAGVPVFFGQAATEHAVQVQAQLDAKYGAGKFIVTGEFNGKMTIKSVDPTCRFTGAHGKTIICCP